MSEKCQGLSLAYVALSHVEHWLFPYPSSLSTPISLTSICANYLCLWFWVRNILGCVCTCVLGKIWTRLLEEGVNVSFFNLHAVWIREGPGPLWFPLDEHLWNGALNVWENNFALQMWALGPSDFSLLIWAAQFKLITVFIPEHLLILDDVWSFTYSCLKHSYFQDQCESPIFAKKLAKYQSQEHDLVIEGEFWVGANKSWLHFGSVTKQDVALWMQWVCLLTCESEMRWAGSDALSIPFNFMPSMCLP